MIKGWNQFISHMKLIYVIITNETTILLTLEFYQLVRDEIEIIWLHYKLHSPRNTSSASSDELKINCAQSNS